MTNEAPPRPSVVPYITAWSREPVVSPPVVLRRGRGGQGLGYADETPYDRDTFGALWVRQALTPKTRRGEPRYETVHALRQRRAMMDFLCQVCGRTTLPQDEDRHLFLLPDIGPVTDGEPTTGPPLCLPCAHIAIAECPPLRRGHIAVRARRAHPWGVAGIPHDPRTLAPLPGRTMEQVPYDSPAIRWMLAARHIVALHGCTPIDLATLV